MIESLEISLKSFESKLVQNAVDQILSTLSPQSSLKFFQISFPQKQKRFTILRSPHVHKKSREQFYVKSYKTMIRFSFLKKKFQQETNPELTVKRVLVQNFTESEKYELSFFLENLKYLKLLGVQMKVRICYTTFLDSNSKFFEEA